MVYQDNDLETSQVNCQCAVVSGEAPNSGMQYDN